MVSLKEKQEKAAILLITHDLAVVAETCDRVIVMYGGVIQEVATIEQLFSNPIHPYTKALLSSIPKLTSNQLPKFDEEAPDYASIEKYTHR